LSRVAQSGQTLRLHSSRGRQVTVSDGKGGIVSGNVAAIEHGHDGPRLVIGENTYALSSVLLTEPVSKAIPTPEPDLLPTG
jgi:hypothetical protein